MTGTHARLSPSGADRWMQCPGSVQLSDGLPDHRSGYADEGTAAHFLASECLANDAHPATHIGRKIVVLSGGAVWAGLDIDPVETLYTVDTDMAGHVNTFVQAVRHQLIPGGVLLVEQQVPIHPWTGEEGATGTADAIVILPDGEIQIHDLKYGQGEIVTAGNNRQLMLYALGAIEDASLSYDIAHARLFIHQPRIHTKASEWAVSLKDLDAFGEEVQQAVGAVEYLDAHPDGVEANLVPGEDQCRWCRAKYAGACRALDNFVHETVLDSFDDLDAAVAGAASLPPETLAEKMATTGLIEQWIKAIRGKVETDLLAAIPVPGYKLVRGKQGNRKWSNATEAEEVMKSMRLKVEEMYDLSLISPTTAEKRTKGEAPAIGPRQWKKLTGLITRSEGGLSVAPEADPREAVVPTPAADAADFDDLGDDLV